MKIKRFIPENKPIHVISDAYDEGMLDDRCNPMYAGLDDDGFARKRDSFKSKFELDELLAENDDHSGLDFDFNRLPNHKYAECDHDGDDFYYCRILDDNDNVIGYYAVLSDVPDLVNKAFVFAGEVEDDSDEERIMFMLLNRMSEAIMKRHELLESNRNDYDRVIPMLVPIEFDEKSARFASDGRRPKKAGCWVKESDFDKFVLGAVENDMRERYSHPDWSEYEADEYLTRTIRCPDEMKLE